MTGAEDAPFVAGLALGRSFFHDVVHPLATRVLGHDRYAAARLDGGSDVLGYDTPISRDHGWGPRVTIFLDESEPRTHTLRDALATELPSAFRGVPVRFAQPDATTTRHAHGVTVTTVDGFLDDYLGLRGVPRTHAAWLGIPVHRLRTVAAGPIFHDEAGRLTSARETLQWYPDDLWHHLLAVQWRRIGEEESFMARAGDVGDDLGSRVVAARQVVEMMRLAFLMERVYPPYFKWFGRAFAELSSAAAVAPSLDAALAASHWRDREQALGRAGMALAERHNQLGVTAPVDTELRPFHGRPYRVLGADRFADALEARATVEVRSLPRGLGAVWQWCDATPALEQPRTTHVLTSVLAERA